MIGTLNRLRDLTRRSGVSGKGDAPRTHESDLPLDHQLTCVQNGEKWTYRDNRILIDDEDARGVIGEAANDVGVLCSVSQGLHDYQQHVWSRGGKGNAKFNGAVHSLQDTIGGRLGSIYEDMTGGVRFECRGEDFWINNINVRSVLNLYRLKPTDKARRYLMGLQQKLDLILSRQRSSTRYDGVREPARQLSLEIEAALEYVPPDAPLCLGDGRRSA
jgi:hypothetical protein